MDLASAGRLRVLEPTQWASLVRREPLNKRPARLALWRHLADQPAHRHLLPRSDATLDAYERWLLTAARGGQLYEPRVLPRGGGLLVVPSMPLGEMDTPGGGSGGGLGIFFAGLGDTLARGLLAGTSVVRGRGPGNRTLTLPTDPHTMATPGTGAALDGRALAWWARRILEGLGRRPDLVHVRYAVDGSLAGRRSRSHTECPPGLHRDSLPAPARQRPACRTCGHRRDGTRKHCGAWRRRWPVRQAPAGPATSVNGILLDTSSSEALAMGLEQLLSLEPAVVNTMAHRAGPPFARSTRSTPRPLPSPPSTRSFTLLRE